MADEERRARLGEIAVQSIPNAIGTVVGGLIVLAVVALLGVIRDLARAELLAILVFAVAGTLALVFGVLGTRDARASVERAEAERRDAERRAWSDALESAQRAEAESRDAERKAWSDSLESVQRSVREALGSLDEPIQPEEDKAQDSDEGQDSERDRED